MEILDRPTLECEWFQTSLFCLDSLLKRPSQVSIARTVFWFRSKMRSAVPVSRLQFVLFLYTVVCRLAVLPENYDHDVLLSLEIGRQSGMQNYLVVKETD